MIDVEKNLTNQMATDSISCLIRNRIRAYASKIENNAQFMIWVQMLRSARWLFHWKNGLKAPDCFTRFVWKIRAMTADLLPEPPFSCRGITSPTSPPTPIYRGRSMTTYTENKKRALQGVEFRG